MIEGDLTIKHILFNGNFISFSIFVFSIIISFSFTILFREGKNEFVFDENFILSMNLGLYSYSFIFSFIKLLL